jgi:hypothetical protein
MKAMTPAIIVGIAAARSSIVLSAFLPMGVLHWVVPVRIAVGGLTPNNAVSVRIPQALHSLVLTFDRPTQTDTTNLLNQK